MIEPDPEMPKLQERKESDKAEDNVHAKGPFLKPFDEEEAIEPHAITQNSAANHNCGLERVFWGDAIALRLRGRVDADGNEANHGISKHLMIPMVSPHFQSALFSQLLQLTNTKSQQKTTSEPANSTSSTDMPPPPQRDISKGFGTAAARTGFKQDLQKDEPTMAFPHPAYAEPVSSPVTGHVEETMHLPRAPQKAIPVPPASYERSMNQSQNESRLSAICKLSLQSVFS